MKENTVKKLKLLAKVLYWVFIAIGCVILGFNVYNAVLYMVAEYDVVLSGTIISIAVENFTSLPTQYSYLVAGVVSFMVCFLTANVLETVFNGFAILVEESSQNTKDNEKLFITLESLNNNINNLNVKAEKVESTKEETKEKVSKETPKNSELKFPTSKKGETIKKTENEVKDSPAVEVVQEVEEPKELKFPTSKKEDTVKKEEDKKTAIKKREGVSKLNEVKTPKLSGDDFKARLEKVRLETQKIIAVKSQVEANSVDGTMLDDVADKSSVVNFETPSKFNQINPGLFRECKNLETIVITDNIKLIGNKAFGGCEALTTVEIGKGVEVIEDSAFDGCTGLKNVIYKGSKKQWDQMVIQSGNELLKGVNVEFKE